MRPSHRELSKKLREANELFNDTRISILEPDVVISDSLDLGYSFKLEFNDVVKENFELARPECYAGTRPPQRSYESTIKGAELFAFVVQSPLLEHKQVYFKFALYQDVLMVVSLHEDRQQEG